MNGNTSGGDGLYPAIAPYSETMLPVSRIHKLYVEHSGNPQGYPVLFLHGGPGSQTRPEFRRFFDPGFYRITLFDQRGCGRSTPAGCTEDNTTWHLVEDMETIRQGLGAERWILFGGSWGSTLALAYAVTYPQRVAGMVLRGVFLGSAPELDWYLHGLRRFVPQEWGRFAAETSANLLEHYRREVNSSDQIRAVAAARRWVEYENSVMAIGAPAMPSGGGSVDGNAVLARVRVQLHYLCAGCFLQEGQLMREVGGVSAPAIIVQGRSDMVCPPEVAYELSKQMPGADLRIVEQAGHAATGPLLAPALRRAADDMRAVVRDSR